MICWEDKVFPILKLIVIIKSPAAAYAWGNAAVKEPILHPNGHTAVCLLFEPNLTPDTQNDKLGAGVHYVRPTPRKTQFSPRYLAYFACFGPSLGRIVTCAVFLQNLVV